MAIVAAGARITGRLGFEEFGAGLAGGDFNGDGFADLAINYRLIGSSRDDSSSTIQIIFGGEDVFAGDLNAADLAGGDVTTSGRTDIGVGVDTPGPLSFSDVNGDGQDDLLIGAPRALSDAALTGGAGYILFGREGEEAFSFGLSELTNGTDGQAFFATGGRNAGSSIVDLGDVDGDGTSELFLGAPFAAAPGGSASSGLGFVFERDADAVTDLSGAFGDPADPAATVVFSAERAFIAEDAAALGDVNGDGVDDFLISASGAIGAGTGPFSGNNGEAYIIYGQNGGLPDQIDVTRLDGEIGTKLFATDIFQVGSQIAAAGDLNGDGYGDFTLIDAGPSTDEPVFYVIYGAEGGLGAEFDISTADGVSKLGGVASVSASSGVDMAPVGDVNEDGFDDILVSRAAGGTEARGEAALLFGSENGLGDFVDLDAIPAGNGYRFVAGPNDFRTGFTVAGPGDLNGDGVNDLVIGSTGYNPDENAEFEFDAPGAAYVVFGGADRLAALDALGDVDGLIALDDVTGEIEVPGEDPLVIYSLGPDISVMEQSGPETTFAVTISRSDSRGAAEVDLAISGDATVASGDFDRIGGSTSFADGQSETTVVYRVVDDALVEPAEQAIFDLSLVSSERPGVIGDGRQVVTIEDNDEPVVYDLGADFTIAERNGEDVSFAVTVTRSSGEGAAEISVATSGVGAIDAFRFIGSDEFADGETETRIIFRLIDDLVQEPTEDLIFDLSITSSDRPGVVGDGQQIVSIQDDDTPSVFSISPDVTVSERNGVNVGFTTFISRSSAVGEAVVNIGLGGTATPFGPARDYELSATTVTFADGETTKAVNVSLVDDQIDEPDETIVLGVIVASSLGPAIVEDGTQVVTIRDDDLPPPPEPVIGGAGSERLTGGLGDDQISGRGGNDTLVGGAGDDALFGGLGGDRIFAGRGDDTANGGVGNDLIVGGDGDDRLAGQPGADNLRGGRGDDTLNGGTGRDLLNGGEDRDFLAGGIGSDTLEGEAGDDVLFGGDGADRMIGGFGDDEFFGGDGADTIFGGSGGDTAAGGDGDDFIFGGAGDDTLRGDDGDDVLSGGSGRDRLLGNGGDDVLFGRSGADQLSGGAGDDRIAGGEGDDTILGGSGRDQLFGGDDDDRLIGLDGDDRLFGGAGDDAMIAGGGRDFMRGGAGDDSLSGNNGNDTLSGESGADLLVGGGGRDFIRGGLGADRLIGGGGDDDLAGGGGADAFVFNGANGSDVIRDFRNGIDRIEITAGADSFAALSIARSGDDAIVRFAQTEIELLNFNASALDASDFVFS